MRSEIALNLSANTHRLVIGKDCFDANGVFLKKYVHIDGQLCAVNKEGNVLQKYLMDYDYLLAKNEFALADIFDQMSITKIFIKLVDEVKIQPYLFISAENAAGSVETIKSILSELELNTLNEYLDKLPSFEHLRYFIYSKKESGNWLYFVYNCELRLGGGDENR